MKRKIWDSHCILGKCIDRSGYTRLLIMCRKLNTTLKHTVYPAIVLSFPLRFPKFFHQWFWIYTAIGFLSSQYNSIYLVPIRSHYTEYSWDTLQMISLLINVSPWAPKHLCCNLISGIVPISEAKTVCAGSEKFYKMCDSNEVGEMNFCRVINVNYYSQVNINA